MTEGNSLHVRVLGEGEPLVMLHGWGMHAAMLENIAQELAQQFQVMLVDLPGHGQSVARHFSLDSITEELARLVDKPAHWLGWSLGGSIVMNLARRYPQQVRSITLVAATPKFVRGANWQCAVAQDALEQFAEDLSRDYAATMKRFLLLQTMGSSQAREVFKSLQGKMKTEAAPDRLALASGLEILRNADLRDAVADFAFPLQVILGERDTLVPLGVGEFYRDCLPHADVAIIPGAGHVPFVSHQQEFLHRFSEHMNSMRGAR